MKKLSEKKSQQSIQNYFKITGVTSRHDLVVSKRVRTALEQMSADPDAPIADDILEKKKPKKKSPKKTAGKKVTNEDGSIGNPKPKARRKRKATTGTEPDSEKPQSISDSEPSTSTAVTISVGAKKIVLPDANAPIPQREKDREMMESNRLKAIEVLKKMKANKK